MRHKKRLVIVSSNLATGGIQKALVNLLNEIADKYDVTVFIYSYSGQYLLELPKQIKIIKANPYMKLLGISQAEAKKEGIFFYFLRALLVLWTKIFTNALPISLLLSTEGRLQGYDIAISYVQSPHDKSFYGGCNEFVLKKIDAKKKFAYIHCDYLHYGGNTPRNKKMYKQFDRIITVSEGCRKHFLQAIPSLSSKTYSVKNCTDFLDIQKKAEHTPFLYDSEKFSIVTVARLSEEKGIIRTIEVIYELVNKGYNISWHLIGDGRLRREIEQLVSSKSLKGHITLHGEQENPYKYMKNADLFLLPSYHEAAPMVLEEAKCIGLPILTTNTTSANEMVEQCGAGWVCQNSAIGMTETLEYILNNREELLQIGGKLKKQQLPQNTGVDQLEAVIDGACGYGQ